MKDYFFEGGQTVNLRDLEANRMDLEPYKAAHKGLVIPCHDVFIQTQRGILLVRRENVPAKGLLWPIGGRLSRGVETQESLKRLVRDECGLELENLELLGMARTQFQTDPVGHGRGTDTLNLVYYAEGKGEITLDSQHSTPTIVRPQDYDSLRKELHPYVRDFMDKLF